MSASTSFDRDRRPDAMVAPPATRSARTTSITVVNGTSLASARGIATRGGDGRATPLVLNFASAKTAGGGFLDGALLEEPYLADFLTAPAPNAGVVLAREPEGQEEVNAVMKARVSRALAICAEQGHRHLVLGAWGCGVFANDPAVVARAFGDALDGAYAGAFDEVVFAVLDWSQERRIIRPFVERFAS